MATRRMIHDSFWQSYTMAELSFRQRLLFIGLFSNADDQGRLKGRTTAVRSMVFPNEDISLNDIESDLRAIEAVGSILIYSVDGYSYIQIVNWWRYQSPQWAYPSDIPGPDGWSDRLRYRRGGNVLTENWQDDGGFDDGEIPEHPHEPLPNALPKKPDDKQVKPQNSFSIGLELESSANADADARDPPPPESDEKPQKQLKGRSKVRSDLSAFFSELTKIPQPEPKNKKGYSAKNTKWWTPLLRIYDLCEEDAELAEKLIVRTVSVMDAEQLTISCPLSVLSNAVSEHARLLRGAPPGKDGKASALRSNLDAVDLWLEMTDGKP